MTGSLHPVAAIPDDVPDLARFAGAVAAHVNSGVLAQPADHDQAPRYRFSGGDDHIAADTDAIANATVIGPGHRRQEGEQER